MFTSLITLLFGIIIGFALAIFGLWLVKIKCPNCKKLKPFPEIILFHWKTRLITGQSCLKCQRPKPQIEIDIY